MNKVGAQSSGSVLLTGAAGFLGRHVAQALIGSGYQVVAMQHRRPLPNNLHDACFNVITGDICDPHVRAVALDGVDVVCHAGAYIPVGKEDLIESDRCYQVNALAVLNLAREAADRGVKRFVHISAGNMYSAAQSPCDEEGRIFPSGQCAAYFTSKLVADIYLSSLSNHTMMSILILRVGTPYGPGEPAGKVIPTLLRNAYEGNELRIVNGQAKYNYIYVMDVVDCIVRAIGGGVSGIYNVATVEHTSIYDLACLVLEVCGKNKKPVLMADHSLSRFEGYPALSIGKMRQEWGVEPRSLVEGLRDYYNNMLKYGV